MASSKIGILKVIIIGGVAGGASCAARLRRLNENAEIIMVERGPYVSYANCGLPYYVGDVIARESSLLVADEGVFRALSTSRWMNSGPALMSFRGTGRSTSFAALASAPTMPRASSCKMDLMPESSPEACYRVRSLPLMERKRAKDHGRVRHGGRNRKSSRERRTTAPNCG
jgi:hypothetical protein